MQKRKIPYEELEAIVVTTVDVAKNLRDKCLVLEAEKNAAEAVLDIAQKAIESRDLIINRYEEKGIDDRVMTDFDELKDFQSDRYQEICKKKLQEMQRKREELLLSKHNFSMRN